MMQKREINSNTLYLSNHLPAALGGHNGGLPHETQSRYLDLLPRFYLTFPGASS